MPTGGSSASESAITSAYLDTFVNENLPPANLQPEFTYELLSLKYPLSLNCGVELLDKMVEKGFGEHRCLRDGAGILLRAAAHAWFCARSHACATCETTKAADCGASAQ